MSKHQILFPVLEILNLAANGGVETGKRIHFVRMNNPECLISLPQAIT
jgi:hypothetical protein